MKRNKIYVAAMTGLMVIASSCTKNFEEINTNPNAPDEAPMTNVLGYVISSLGYRFGETEMIYPGSFAGHITKANYTDAVVYSGKPSSSIWTGCYSTVSRNANAIINEAIDKGNVNMQAAAMVLKAYALQMVTDVYGPCPYFEAGKGDEGLIHPVFDTEEAIYNDLFDQLESASMLFTEDPLGGLLGDGDLLFGGDIANWKKFSNSLQLRMAIRISNVKPQLATEVIGRILGNPDAYPVFESNEDNAALIFPGDEEWMEPWTSAFRSIGDNRMAKPLVDSLLSYDDPRIAYYADTTASGTYEGLEVGEEGLKTSKPGPLFIDNPAGPVKFLTYAELQFIMAEAGLRGLVTLDAQQAYEAGITASMKEYGIEDADIAAYLQGPKVVWKGEVDQVNIQKWLSLFHQSWEAWAEMRRTDIPRLKPAANSEKPGHNRPPFRFCYPETEISLNSANIPASVDEEDTYWGYQVWWDTRTGVH